MKTISNILAFLNTDCNVTELNKKGQSILEYIYLFLKLLFAISS